jgi:hypothetical protein
VPKIYGWLLFPGLWLIFVVVACAARLDAALAGALSFVVGLISYVVSRVSTPKFRSRAHAILKWPLAVTGILVVSVVMTRVYYWITWDPIGTIDDGWGTVPGLVFQDVVREWPAAQNGSIVAAIRRTSSGLLSADVTASYFVFVHRISEGDSEANLAFRYFATERGFDLPPQIRWGRDNSVIVLVGDGDILMITKQRRSTDGARVAYEIGPGVYPPETAFWQRPLF